MGLAIKGLVEVRPCPHGRGLAFASRDIGRGSVIREFEDIVLISHPSSSPHGRYALQIGENEYWDGFARGSPDYWSNFIDHAEYPNAVFVIDRERRRAWLQGCEADSEGRGDASSSTTTTFRKPHVLTGQATFVPLSSPPRPVPNSPWTLTSGPRT